MFYSKPTFIKAHQDIHRPKYNHSYDRYSREVECSKCGKTIGEQDHYTDWTEGVWRFQNEKDNYKFCPYCGHEFTKR